MFSKLKAELDAVMARDPAARSRAEVYFLYSGFKAVRSYRKANWFFRHNMKFIARYISQRARRKTGIEIHPGATIGKNLFIDHGMGVVIGETTVIGDNCTLYQGVTLGGTSLGRGEKRHPTLEPGVIVGAGAKVLGGWTVGRNARIGSNAVCLKPIAANATIVGVPGHVAGEKKAAKQADHEHFSAYGVVEGAEDPVTRAFNQVRKELDVQRDTINRLEREIAKLKGLDEADAPAIEDPAERSFLDSAL